MIFYIPIRIYSEPNNTSYMGQGYWAQRKRFEGYEKTVRLVLRPHEDKFMLPCVVQLIRIAPRELDYDNWVASCKGIRDTIAALIIPGLAAGRADADPRLSFEYLQKKGVPKQYALQIIIEPKQKVSGEGRTLC